MNFFRTLVSGKKNRYQQEGFNLDLTYVCPRIIAMAFPAEGLEGIYRNPIDQVAELIYKRHGLNYLVLNLSGRVYNYSKFENRVLEFAWEDHHSPPIHMLFQICQQIHQFLQGDIKRVMIIHCLAGKGRTGTIICCYLLFCGRLKTVQEALEYYGKKRFHSEGLGVNQPCQVRYVEYFFRMLNGDHPLYPNIKYINRINFEGKPHFNMDGGCKPSLSIFHARTKKVLFNQKIEFPQPKKFIQGSTFQIDLQQPILLCGDFLIKIYNIGMMKNTLMLRLALNTAFIPDGKNEQLYQLTDMDPSQITTDDRFPPNFSLRVEFDNFCKCQNITSFDLRCSICSDWVNSEKSTWSIIGSIIEMHETPTLIESQILLFGNIEADDIDRVLNDKNWILTHKEDSYSNPKKGYHSSLSLNSSSMNEDKNQGSMDKSKKSNLSQ